MCHYITAYVPKDADLAAVEALLEQNKFGFSVIENPHVRRQIASPVVQILSTRGMCDCGTSLASARQFAPGGPPSERELAKLRKKGWSAARIRRWLDEKAAAVERQEAAEAQLGTNAGPETERWVRVIGQMLTSQAARWVGVLVHEYRHGLNSERIAWQAPEEVRLVGLTEDVLREMSEDTMLIVRP